MIYNRMTLPVLGNPAKPIASGEVHGGDVVTSSGQNYFDRIKSDPKRKHDYYPDSGELRDAWINENPPFYGEEQDTESYD